MWDDLLAAAALVLNLFVLFAYVSQIFLDRRHRRSVKVFAEEEVVDEDSLTGLNAPSLPQDQVMRNHDGCSL